MTYYTLTVDTEEEWDWDSGYPTQPPTVENIDQLMGFQKVADNYGGKVTYFTNHAVLADPHACRTISRLSTNPNAEIGLHIHPWNTPPLGETSTVSPRMSFLHNARREAGIAKLDTVLDAFESRDLSPSSFRGGRYSTCDWIQQHLHARGIIADASILPFTTWADEGAPDFRHRQPMPQRIEMGSGTHGLWEIPLTMAFTRKPWTLWRRFYQTCSQSPLRHLRMIGIAERTIVNKVWLNLEHPLGEHFERLLQALKQLDLPCINFTMHSSSLLVGGSPYSKTSADVAKIFERLERALSTLASWPNFQPATISEVASYLEEAHHARLGN